MPNSNPWDKYPIIGTVGKDSEITGNPWDKYPIVGTVGKQDSSLLGSIGDVIKSLGSGFVSGVKEAGLAGMKRAVTAPDEETMWLPMEERAKMEAALTAAENKHLQEKEKKLAQLSSPARIAHKATEWVGGGVMTPGVLPIAKGAKALAALGGFDLGTGVVSGTLQETGMGKTPSDLLALLTRPVAIGVKKGEKKLREVFSTAEDRTALHELKMLQKEKEALSPALHHAYEKVYGKSETDTVGDILRNLDLKKKGAFLDPKHIPRQDLTGRGILDALSNRLESLKKYRAEETKPLYDLASTSGVRVNPTSFRSTVRDIGEHEVGDVKSSLDEILKMTASTNLHPKKVIAINRRLGDMIGSAKASGKENLARELTGIKKHLEEKIIEPTPYLREAQARYSELSEPINQLTEHPLMSKAFKNVVDHKGYTSIVPDALKSKQAARELVQELRQVPNGENVLKSIKRQMYGNILENVSTESDRFSLNKASKWMRENSGALAFDPSLETRMKNVSNIRLFRNEFLRKVSKQPVQEILEEGTLKYFNAFNKNILKFKQNHMAGITKLDKQIRKISDDRKKVLIDTLLTDKNFARFMMSPLKSAPDFLEKHPMLLPNINRLINDLKE